jgi:8-oxo-dGTP pyrophosphatase MutT (NUDIX family)
MLQKGCALLGNGTDNQFQHKNSFCSLRRTFGYGGVFLFIIESEVRKMKHEFSYGAVVYRYENEKLLLLIEYMRHGHVSIPKGHIEKGETPLDCTKREIKEETNLDVIVDQSFSHTIHYAPYPGSLKRVIFYLATPTTFSLIPQKEEVNELKWMTLEEALKVITFASDKRTLKLAVAAIEKKHAEEKK